MRTNIVIDDKLMADALSVSGLQTKKEAVEEGLKALIRLRKQASIRTLRGKLNWDGDLNDMRTPLGLASIQHAYARNSNQSGRELSYFTKIWNND